MLVVSYRCEAVTKRSYLYPQPSLGVRFCVHPLFLPKHAKKPSAKVRRLFDYANYFVRMRRCFFSGGFFMDDILLSLSFMKARSFSSKLSSAEAVRGAGISTGGGAVRGCGARGAAERGWNEARGCAGRDSCGAAGAAAFLIDKLILPALSAGRIFTLTS